MTYEGVQVIRKAERLPNGRVKGYSPAQLWPKVVMVLKSQDQAQFFMLTQQAIDLKQKQRELFLRLGLDPKKTYRISKNGEVIEIGQHIPRY